MIYRALLCAALLFFSLFPLHSENLYMPEKPDFSEFPVVKITAGIDSPYPVHIIRNKKAEQEVLPVFFIEETFRGKSREAEIISVTKRDRSLTGLDLILIMDITRSVSAADFSSFIKTADHLRASLEKNDRMAFLTFNGDLHLKIELTEAHDESLAQTLRSLKREGERTRIFDALYGGLSAAYRIRSGQTEKEKSDGIIRKTAVIIFTDTKDEGSYIPEDDLHRLIHSGNEWKIPVYSFLAGTKVKSEPFRRLALKTGGKVYGLTTEDTQEFQKEADRFRNGLLEIKFRSNLSAALFPYPGEKIFYRIRLLNGRQSASLNFEKQVSFEEFYRIGSGNQAYTINPAGLLLWAFLLLLTTGFIVLIFYSMRRPAHHDQKKENAATGKSGEKSTRRVFDFLKAGTEKKEPSAPLAAENMHEYIQERKIYDNLYNKSEYFDDEEIAVGQFNSFSYPDRSGKNPPLSSMQNPERYMQEYAYHLLQLAVRNGEKYTDARITLLKDGPREETKEYDLFLTATVIGSGKWSHIRLHDSSVSPVHAKIKRVDGRFILYDLLSRSGVFLNGKKLLRPRALTDGDEIRIGKLRFIFTGIRNED